MAIAAKRRVSEKIERCHVIISGQLIHVDINILPLGSYDVLIGMDQLEGCWYLVDCKEKSLSYLTKLGQRKEIQGIKKNTKLCPITSSQLGKCIRKGCQIYVIQVGYTNSKSKLASLENILVIQDFFDVFPKSIPGLPPKCDIDFMIELVPRATLISRTPYCMSIPELTKLKMQLQELLDKGYIFPSVSPWEAPILFVREKGQKFEAMH